MLGQFCFWPLVMRCLYFFTFSFSFALLRFKHPSVTHTKRLSPFFLISTRQSANVFLSFTDSHLSALLPLFSSLPPALLFQLSFSFWLWGKAVYLFRQDLFPPPPLTSPHPPVFLSFSFHSLITFLFPPGYVLVEYHYEGEKGGEKKGERVKSAVEVEEKFLKRE